MKLYTPFDLSKSADDQIVYGIASTATIDDQGGEWEGQRYDGDIVDPQALREALGGYWGNVRAMHGDEAVGKALDVLSADGVTYLVAKIIDPAAWQKVKEEVYKGFSIGGRLLKARLEKLADGRIVRRITKLLLTEISLVDRPANPQAAILLYKRATDMSDTEEVTTEEQANPLEAVGAMINKASSDPKKVVAMVQAMRNEMELAGDLEGAERMTQAIGLLLIGAGEAEAGDLEEDIASDEEQDAGDLEMAADDSEMMADDEEEADKGMMAMSAKASITKAGRKIAAGRMAIMKQAVMAYLKVLADAGDGDSTTMLKAIESGGGLMDGKAMIAEIQKSMNAPLEKIAAAVLNLDERTRRLEAQPAPGGPVNRFVGQPVNKTIGGATIAKGMQPDNSQAIARLRSLIATETRPSLIDQYQAELQRLTGN